MLARVGWSCCPDSHRTYTPHLPDFTECLQNSLNGPIPATLAAAPNLAILDLSNNSFSGERDPCGSLLTRGQGQQGN
jgi:hypothetical protein